MRTVYIALSFTRTKEGHLVAAEAKPCSCASAAAHEAEIMRSYAAGAVAFTRDLDDDFGRCGSAALLSTLGDVPRLDYLFAA